VQCSGEHQAQAQAPQASPPSPAAISDPIPTHRLGAVHRRAGARDWRSTHGAHHVDVPPLVPRRAFHGNDPLRPTCPTAEAQPVHMACALFAPPPPGTLTCVPVYAGEGVRHAPGSPARRGCASRRLHRRQDDVTDSQCQEGNGVSGQRHWTIRRQTAQPPHTDTQRLLRPGRPRPMGARLGRTSANRPCPPVGPVRGCGVIGWPMVA
jgi:hypothetical protein